MIWKLPAICALAGLASAANGQSVGSSGLGSSGGIGGFVAPGTGVEAPLQRQQALERGLKESLWRWGAVRVDPWFGISEGVVLDSGLDGEQPSSTRADIAVTLDAGLRGYLPIGPKVIVSGELVPGYTLWREASDRSQNQLDAAAHFDAFLNRLQIHLGGTRTEGLERPSSESSFYASRRREMLEGQLEIELRPQIFLFFDAAELSVESLEKGDDFDFLGRDDRDETVYAYGARLRPTDVLSFDLGWEIDRVDFATGADDRSLDGDAPFVAVTAEGVVTLVRARLLYRDLTPRPGSVFVPWSGLAGRIEVQRHLGWRASLELQLLRDVLFAVSPDFSRFETDRVRLGLNLDLTRALSLRLFNGRGDDAYVRLAPGPERSDDVSEWGADVDLALGRLLSLRLGYARERFESSVPAFDRDFDRFRFGIGLSALGGRLRVQ